MDKVLSINETFFLLRYQSFDTEHKQFLCVSDMKIWLIIHFIIIRFVELFLSAYISCLLYMMMIFCNSYSSRIGNLMESNWSNIYDLDRYSLMIIVLKKEMKLIFFYVYIAFLYTWFKLVDSSYIVTYYNFLRWLIEASLLPQILIITLFLYFLCLENFFELYHLFYIPTIITKIPLFVVIRYGEIQSDFFLNGLETFLFNRFCY